MHCASSESNRASLRLTVLEDRSVPSATTLTASDPHPVAATTHDTRASTDPQPVLVGTNSQGEAIYTVTVQPTVCNCAACQAARAAAARATQLSQPTVSAPPASGVTTPPASPPPAATPLSDAQPRPASLPSSVAFTSSVTQTVNTPPTPVVVTRSDAGYSLLAPPQVETTAHPDLISAPASTTPPTSTDTNALHVAGWVDPLIDVGLGMVA